MKPPRSILSKDFKWVPPAKQDCAATFRRIRREIEAQTDAQHAKVTALPKAKHG